MLAFADSGIRGCVGTETQIAPRIQSDARGEEAERSGYRPVGWYSLTVSVTRCFLSSPMLTVSRNTTD